MSPREEDRRLEDVLAAAEAIRDHLTRGSSEDGLVYDAVRVRLIEIGEAVKGIGPGVLERKPSIPWSDMAGMRDYLTHRYFDADHAIVSATVDRNLPPLVDAVRRLLER
ncbi:MAG: HepT-like ribonuclease domain-containing protein [Pseudonocardiaceae bacterium]